MKKTAKHQFDDSFYKLANQITAAIARNNDGSDQKKQVETLVSLEKQFKEVVLSYKQSKRVYQKFLQKICVENNNKLSARPYFRETGVTFSKKITPAINNNDIELLQSFGINYHLIRFIREAWLGPFPKKAEALYQAVHKARTVLIENNMPLAINRAKLFYRKTPKAHLNLMDMIQICSMGLSAGIDKYVGKYTPVFRSVAIGRMTGNLIDSYSETVLHFYPSDKRILYRANSIRGRQGIEDIVELTRLVNESFAQDKKEGKTIPQENITVSQLAYILGAASIINASETKDDDTGMDLYTMARDDAPNPEEAAEQSDQMKQIVIASRKLSVVQRKILRLKGISI